MYVGFYTPILNASSCGLLSTNRMFRAYTNAISLIILIMYFFGLSDQQHLPAEALVRIRLRKLESSSGSLIMRWQGIYTSSTTIKEPWFSVSKSSHSSRQSSSESIRLHFSKQPSCTSPRLSFLLPLCQSQFLLLPLLLRALRKTAVLTTSSVLQPWKPVLSVSLQLPIIYDG